MVCNGVTEFLYIWGLGLECCGAYKGSFVVSPLNSDTSPNANKPSLFPHTYMPG